ncbi:MAG TPA: glycerate kinase, partial [Candidatus Kapabacteria bacterium]
MSEKILLVTSNISGILDATDAASLLARLVRSSDPALAADRIVQLPLVDGGAGTIDFLVTHSLGSFLEVEAHNARGEDAVVPLGFAGEDGKLAVIEMARAAGVPTLGTAGTTAGIGELIQDALDEGAFSIVLGHEEALARDAGLGAAQALGVCFFDVSGNPLDLAKPSVSLEAIARIDASNRSFSLLSSRIFIARSRSVAAVPDSSELNRLREIVQRDLGVRPPMVPQSASAIEFGLTALLGAEVRDGVSLILEASGISEAVRRKEFSYAIFFIEQENEGQALTEFLELCRECIPQRAMLSTSFPSE